MVEAVSPGPSTGEIVESAITYIDGNKGELRYRGYPIADLVSACAYEDVALLIWDGELPKPSETEALKQDLRSAAEMHGKLVTLLEKVPARSHPLDVLRYVLSWDALVDPSTWDNDPSANRSKAIAFTAWFPLITAALHRLRRGLRPVEPLPDLGLPANFLFMLHGKEPDEVSARTAQISFILHAEHELNASTYAARVTIGTQSSLHAAIASALGTLAGPRHGGASDRVIHMLEEIQSPSQVETYVRDLLARKGRVMGFGHRVYKTTDPRSVHLREMAERILENSSHAHWIGILDQLRVVMERERNLYPNVDLYAAVVNHELGIDPAFYTSVFACARMPGWTAHAMEQLHGRMIRPDAAYSGSALRHVSDDHGPSRHEKI